MKRVISKFGAYTNHIATLSEDHSVMPADCAKLKGYDKNWDMLCSLIFSPLALCSRKQCRVMRSIFLEH